VPLKVSANSHPKSFRDKKRKNKLGRLLRHNGPERAATPLCPRNRTDRKDATPRLSPPLSRHTAPATVNQAVKRQARFSAGCGRRVDRHQLTADSSIPIPAPAEPLRPSASAGGPLVVVVNDGNRIAVVLCHGQVAGPAWAQAGGPYGNNSPRSTILLGKASVFWKRPFVGRTDWHPRGNQPPRRSVVPADMLFDRQISAPQEERRWADRRNPWRQRPLGRQYQLLLPEKSLCAGEPDCGWRFSGTDSAAEAQCVYWISVPPVYPTAPGRLANVARSPASPASPMRAEIRPARRLRSGPSGAPETSSSKHAGPNSCSPIPPPQIRLTAPRRYHAGPENLLLAPLAIVLGM